MSELLVKKIIDPFRPKEKITAVEIKMYSQMIKNKPKKNDDNELAKDIFSQLIDTKEINLESLRN